MSFSVSAISLDDVKPSAAANLKTVVIVGWFCPVSMREMKLRWTPDSSPNCSWLKPAPARMRRVEAVEQFPTCRETVRFLVGLVILIYGEY